jgi:hypothetical protein
MLISNSSQVFRLRVQIRTTLQSFLAPKSKEHNLTGYECGQDYAFDPIDEGQRAHMTGQRAGITSGDILKLSIDARTVRYRVVMIDYYADPPDMWIASLSKLNDKLH